MLPSLRVLSDAALVALLVSGSGLAPLPTHAGPSADQPAAVQTPIPIPQVTVTVSAQKEPADAQKLPVSVTAVPKATLENAGATTVSDAAAYAPNTYFSEFTARKLSNARFRGIGSSPANPGITTYIDGVPQLNTNSSSLDLLDVDQVEFVRGSQSALFGRNALGGVINIMSGRPSIARWIGGVIVPLGSNGARDVQGCVSGPVTDKLAISLTFGAGRRDGFTTNDLTGHNLDSRSATLFKGQVLWTPTTTWEARVIVTKERARDGDYALSDLGGLRANPFHAARDFEGRTDRDILATTILTRYQGPRLTFSTVTGFVNWKTRDVTDLDYTPLPLVTRDNAEEDSQFTQEVRLASAAATPVKVSDTIALKWQAGAFFFKQNYDQDAVNSFAPFLLSPFLGFPISQHSPQAALDDHGLGLYGQATLMFGSRVDATIGLRMDHESKTAALKTSFEPIIAPDVNVAADKSFSDVSPQLAFAFRLQPDRTVYASVGRGFKAGGFNPVSIPGSEGYGQERAWHVEGGLKASWAGGRVSTSAAVFSINWTDLQLNLPVPGALGQFYIANVGDATSRGVEFELNARPHANVDLFASVGYTRARFSAGSVSGGVDVAGRRLPNTPDYTATFGTQISHALGRAATLYGRAEMVFYGAFQYDDANTSGQEAYSLANFRAGVRRGHVFGEAWVKNAFDTRYIPLAFAYPNFAPSGFVGESGKPRTFGVRVGVTF